MDILKYVYSKNKNVNFQNKLFLSAGKNKKGSSTMGLCKDRIVIRIVRIIKHALEVSRGNR